MVLQNWLSGLFGRMQKRIQRRRVASSRMQPSRLRQGSAVVETLEPRIVLSPIVALNDSFSVQSTLGSSTPNVMDVLANDSGGTGTLSIASVGTVPFGTVSIQPPQAQGSHQTLLFTPVMGYSGNESFSYTATDNAGDYATAMVSVSVASGYGSSAPQISAMSSHFGSTLGGGTPITISGSGFSGVSAVLFGNSLAASYTVDSSSSITVFAPAHTSGTVDVTVVTSMGSNNPSMNDQYTFQVPIGLPAVNTVSPGTATTSGGTTITITGSNFNNVSGISFGGTSATSFTVTSSTSITAVAPMHISGQVDVQVTTAYGTSATGAGDQLVFTTPILPPAVTGLTALSGPVAGGNSITILGTNFTNVTRVSFGTVAAKSYVVNSSSSITAVVPAGVAGAVDITVTNTAGTSGSLSADQYTYESSAPTVTGLSTTSGYTTGGTPVAIVGTNMTSVTAVLFGTVPATSFMATSPTSITAIAPAEVLGTVDVTLRSSSGTSSISASDKFTFVLPPPTVTAISVSSGPVTGGTTVVISGTQFANATGVLFGSTPASSFKINSDGTITAVSPAASVGVADIRVTNSSGTSLPTAADQFNDVNPVAVVTGVSVESGGTQVTVTGHYFTGATSVMFGSVPTTSFTVNSDTTIVATVPATSFGTIDVKIVNTSGISATSAADQFTCAVSPSSLSTGGALNMNPVGVPIIDGMDNASGSSAGGDTVTIYGVGFSTVTRVMFGSVTAASFSVQSDNRITAVTAPQRPGTVNITLLTPAGPSVSAGNNQFAIADANAVPAVTGLTPMSDSTAEGSLVTILGTDFNNVTDVSFGGTSAQFVVQSPTRILAMVPSGMTAAPNVTVTNGNGTSSPMVFAVATSPSGNVNQAAGQSLSPNGEYVVPGDAGIPLFTPSGIFSGCTGPAMPWTVPLGLALFQEAHPVTTVEVTSDGNGLYTTSDGLSWMTITTASDTGTTKTDKYVTTNSDGSVETIIVTKTLSYSYFATNTYFGSAPSEPSSLVIKQTLCYGISDSLVAANGTGFKKLTSQTWTTSYQGTNVNGTTQFSSDNLYTLSSSDIENGIGSIFGTDSKSVILSELVKTDDSASGFTSPTNVTTGVFFVGGNGIDSYLDTDINVTPTDKSMDQVGGTDKWVDSSGGTFTANPAGQNTCSDIYSGNRSGGDLYTHSDIGSSTLVTPDSNGTTTVFDASMSMDSGSDTYGFIGFGSLSLAATGTISSVDDHIDSVWGTEKQTQSDSGWQHSVEFPSEGTVVDFHDNFGDSAEDDSKYRDSDMQLAGTVNGGTDTLSDTSSDKITFGTSDQVAETVTRTNQYGTPTVATITDQPGDQGTLTDSSTIGDTETLGLGEVDVGDAIVFDNKSQEKDTATDILKITIATDGLVGIGENLDSTETLNLSGTSPSSDIYDDPGTDDSTPNSDKESDISSETMKTADTIFIEDKVVATDTKTLSDGTVITDSVNNDDTDQITDTETDQAGDNHTDTSGAGGANEKTSDDNTFDDEYTGSDNYSNNDNFSETIVTPVTGGTITISDGENLVINNGLAGETDSAVGEVNTANPAVNDETDTTDATNVDQGTDETTDSLSLIVTDPTTGVSTVINAEDSTSDNFGDDDGDMASDSSAGGTAAPESDNGHNNRNDQFSGSSHQHITVNGSTAPGVTIDFLQDETTSGYGKDHNNVSDTSSAPGTDWSHDDFSEEDHETVDGGGHANTTYNTSTNDGHGNTSIISESDYVTDTFDDRFNNSDSGGETITDSANTETSDTEGDSDTETDTLHATTNETNTAHDVYTSTFPTGLVAKATYDDNGSTDAITYDLSDYLTDSHSSSLGTGVSDTKSGGFSAKSVDVENDHIQEGVNFNGKDSNGTLLELVETASQNDTVTDTQSNINTLNSDGSDSDTIGDIRTARGTVTDSVTGTVTSVDPTTGNATTLAYQDTLTDTGSSSSSDGDIVTQTANGASTNTASHTDGGSDTFTWAISETETQADKNGNSIGSSDSNTDSGSGTETFFNGVVTSATLNTAAGNNHSNAAAAVANAVGTTSTAQAAPSAGATNGTSGKRTAPVGGYEAPWWSGVQGFAHGFFVTGSKAIVNQSAKAVGGLVSLGRWEPGNLIGVNPQTDIGYDSAAVPARIAAESTIAAATMGASNLGRAGQVLNAVDTAGNLVNGTAGVVDVVQTGQVTLKNVTQIATGGIAVVQVIGASRSIAKGCPGHSGNCFVAGTQVVVSSAQSRVVFVAAGPMESPVSGDSNMALSFVLMIGAGIAMAITKAKLKNNEDFDQQPRRRRKPEWNRHKLGIDPGPDVNELGTSQEGEEFQSPNLIEYPSVQRRRMWLSRSLTAAMLFCFALGVWFGTHSFSIDHTKDALAISPSGVENYLTKNIEEIEEGDLVLARDEHGTEIGWKPVVEVYRRRSLHLRHLKFRDSTGNEQILQTTDEHPFFAVTQDKFVDAGNLETGDLVVGSDGRTQELVQTFREEHPSGIPVFNFQVQDFHTYFVKAEANSEPILVHNNDYGTSISRSAEIKWNNGWRTLDGKFASPSGPRRSGAAAETAVWDAVESKPGWQVIRGQISVRDASGQLRVYDGVAISPRQHYIGLEVKSGSGRLSAKQRAFDSALNASGPQTVSSVGKWKNLRLRRAIEIRRP